MSNPYCILDNLDDEIPLKTFPGLLLFHDRIGAPSFCADKALGNGHHVRVSNYILEQENLWSVGGSQETLKDEWVVEDFNVTEALKGFKLASSIISPRKLSDMRLLAMNSIYLFSLDKFESISGYMDYTMSMT